jgi:hypothetical protein
LSELHESVRAVLENRLERGRAALSQPFKGITTDGNVVPDLFPIARTGSSTSPMVDAARELLSALTPQDRERMSFPIDSNEWRAWHNAHPFLFRHGVCLHHLVDEVRAKAMTLVRASLSPRGFESVRNAMKLREHLFELTGRREEHGEWYYFFSVFGEPSETAPWGWQIDGHHLIINCFVLGDQVVLTPHFLGGEPVLAESGKYAGTRILAGEEAAGHALMSALSPRQQAKARISPNLPRELFSILHWDNHVMPYEGIRYDELTAEQRVILKNLLEVHVGHLRQEHAQARLAQVLQYLTETYFSWIGECDDESPFYYRVQSPVILVEFVHQPGVAFDNPEASRNHAHSLVRTPNGNDYGRALLGQYQLQRVPA